MALPEDELKKKKNSFGDAAAVASDPSASLVSQIPTGGHQAPAADGSQNSGFNTELGRNVTNTLMAVPGVGGLGRVAATTGRISTALNDASAAVNTAGRVLNAGAVSGSPAAPVVPVPPAPLSAAAQKNPAAPGLAIDPNGQYAGPLMGYQPTRDSQPGAAEASPLSKSNITRVGNSYSAAGPVTGDVTINGQPPRNGGAISEQNEGAASGLARQQLGESLARLGTAPQAAGFQPQQFQQSQWASDLARKNAETQASSIHAPTAALGRANVAMLQGERAGALSADAASQRTAMQESGALARSGNQEQGANFRAGLAAQGVQDANTLRRDEFNRSGVAEGFKVDAMKQLQAAQMALTNAKTPEERKAASDTLLALQGRDRPNRFTVVPGGQDTGEDGRPINRPSSVLDNQTGQFVQSPAGQKQASTAPLQNHISALRSDPKLAAQFDEQYGAGASAKILGVK